MDDTTRSSRAENSYSITSTSLPEDDEALKSPSQQTEGRFDRSDVKLWSASRKPKKSPRRERSSQKDGMRARECHNLVEKQYRCRLKAQFEALLAVLPVPHPLGHAGQIPSASRDQYFSRGQVLDAARERILQLEEAVEQAAAVRDRLLGGLAYLRQAHQEAGFEGWPVQ